MSIKNWTIGGLGALVLGLAASSLTCKPCNDLARKVSGKELPLFGRVNGNTQNKNPAPLPKPHVADDEPAADEGSSDDSSEKTTESAEVESKSSGSSEADSSSKKPSFVKVGNVGNKDVFKYDLGKVRDGEGSFLYAVRFNKWDDSSEGDTYKKVGQNDVYNNKNCKPQKNFMKGMPAYVCVLPNNGESGDTPGDAGDRAPNNVEVRSDSGAVATTDPTSTRTLHVAIERPSSPDLGSDSGVGSSGTIELVVNPYANATETATPAESGDSEDDSSGDTYDEDAAGTSGRRDYTDPFGVVLSGDPVAAQYGTAIISGFNEAYQDKYRTKNSGKCLSVNIGLEYAVGAKGELVSIRGYFCGDLESCAGRGKLYLDQPHDSSLDENFTFGRELIKVIRVENSKRPLVSVKRGNYVGSIIEFGCE